MTEAGDIHLADLNDEQRRRVLVVSNGRFNRLSDRVIVVPELPGPPDATPFPWRIESGGAVFAVDFIRAIPATRLLKRTGRATPDALARIQRAIRHMT